MFRLDDERVVDATMTGGVARYINHSCDPNCVTETVELADTHIIIFAATKSAFVAGFAHMLLVLAIA